MIVTQSSDPRENWFVLASYLMPRHKRTFHQITMHESRSGAEAKAKRLRQDAEIMNSDDLDAAVECVRRANRLPIVIRQEITMSDLRSLYPPRFNVSIMALAKS